MMNQKNDLIEHKDIFDLNRFLKAQATTYQGVLKELKNGRKQSHWMWYIFPQLDGLAQSHRLLRRLPLLSRPDGTNGGKTTKTARDLW